MLNNNLENKQQNVVIIGAPRSGTNMLRDLLTSFDAIGTWPCDEINYIWRHGNIRYPSDELPPEAVRPGVKKYIRGQFDSLAKSQNLKIIVEKTCANSLRVPFVDRVLPEAKYIYIYRDGIDATGSAKLRWTAKLDIAYILKKVRYVPIVDLPYYAVRYLWARVYRLISRENRLKFWGPSLANMQAILHQHTLDEVCALQWQRCVDKADKALDAMPADKVIRVCYEDFVRHPTDELKRILLFMGCNISDEDIAAAVKGVSSKSLGKGRKAIGEHGVKHLEVLIEASLQRYGYI